MLLFLFDLIWDIMPDLMHINTGIWHRHFLKMLTGQREPAPVKTRKKNTLSENKALEQDHADCKKQLATWTLTKVQHAPCVYTPRSVLT